MKKYLMIFGGVFFSLSSMAANFSITVPAGSSQGTTSEQIIVECSQMMASQSLQMSCSLPGQHINQKSQVHYYSAGKNVGDMYLNGIINNTPANAQINVLYQPSPPYQFSYTPSLQLGWISDKDVTLTCDNISTRTAYCQVIN